jgi:2-polyprenyl-3-methyl-5-hydroxy-6-metoxy-1,4-benzoquinol methylase
LPWHREGPLALLERVVAEGTARGRALDLGCGEGVYAVHLAQQGYSVVGVDFVSAAVDTTRERTNQANVDVELHEIDVLAYRARQPFDLVLDSGCLHHLPNAKRERYRNRLDEWLAPGGDFVLVHFINRPRVAWMPGGPRHMSRDEAVKYFAPLQLRWYQETFFDVPFPMGRMRAGV